MTSACDVLRYEAQRFINYIFANEKIRKNIIDKQSFNEALEKVLKSDNTLKNIIETIKKSGESLDYCGENIYELSEIKNLIKENLKHKKKEFREKIKKEKPKISRQELIKEVNRRLQIFISQSSKSIKKTKQLTIDEAKKPIRVKSYIRKGIKVKGYRKTKYKRLTEQERMLILKGIKKGKSNKEIANEYMRSGLGYRTQQSILSQIKRIKKKKI